jgi:hypothetical protein
VALKNVDLQVILPKMDEVMRLQEREVRENVPQEILCGQIQKDFNQEAREVPILNQSQGPFLSSHKNKMPQKQKDKDKNTGAKKRAKGLPKRLDLKV